MRAERVQDHDGRIVGCRPLFGGRKRRCEKDDDSECRNRSLQHVSSDEEPWKMFRLGMSPDAGVMKGDEKRCWRSECPERARMAATPSSLPAAVLKDDFSRPQSLRRFD